VRNLPLKAHFAIEFSLRVVAQKEITNFFTIPP
jgi:hypothetical protein